jgi:hypothetical protein
MVEHVVFARIEYWSTGGDDKDPDPSNTVEHQITVNGIVVLRRNVASISGYCIPPFGAGERWDHRGTAGPYPARRLPGGVPPDGKEATQAKFDTGHDDDRTFTLDLVANTNVGQGIEGNLSVFTNGGQNWDNFNVRLYGITDNGRTIRYDPGNWVASKPKGSQGLATWSFSW